MRQERFKMERQGLVVEGQQVEVTERSPNTNLFTYVVDQQLQCLEFTRHLSVFTQDRA